jgi:hypothetical protein
LDAERDQNSAPNHSPQTRRRLLLRNRRTLVKAVNTTTVQHAVKYVYGLDDRMLAFARKHMSTRRHLTLLERIAAYRGHEITAPDSPAPSAAPEQWQGHST